MEPALDLKLKDDDPWKVTKMAYDIIVACLRQPFGPVSDTAIAPGPLAVSEAGPDGDECSSQPDSISDTVAAIDSLSPGKRKLDEGEKLEEPVSFLLEFWECFLQIAKQVPHDHPGQARLLGLVQGLEKLSPGAAEGGMPEKTIWTYLPELENSIVFIWKEPSEMEDTFEPFQECVNFNSFVARLVGAGLLKKFWYFGLWVMRWSLEGTEAQSNDMLMCRIATSAQWIQHSGQILLNRLRDGEASDLDHRRYGSPLFKAEKVFSLDRWFFWKAKLDEAIRLDISDEVKAAAARAIRHMDEMEVSQVTTNLGT